MKNYEKSLAKFTAELAALDEQIKLYKDCTQPLFKRRLQVKKNINVIRTLMRKDNKNNK